MDQGARSRLGLPRRRRRGRGGYACAAAALVVGFLVGGCSSSTTSTTSTATSPAGRTITVTIAGRTVTPVSARVDLAIGESLTLVVTSDHDDELHAHGFDVEKPLTAGQPTTVTLTGRDAGVFEIETHEPPLTLLTVAVR